MGVEVGAQSVVLVARVVLSENSFVYQCIVLPLQIKQQATPKIPAATAACGIPPVLGHTCTKNGPETRRLQVGRIWKLARGVRRSFVPDPGERVRIRPAAAVTGYRMKRTDYDTYILILWDSLVPSVQYSSKNMI